LKVSQIFAGRIFHRSSKNAAARRFQWQSGDWRNKNQEYNDQRASV
jgi:hypothetical protein